MRITESNATPIPVAERRDRSGSFEPLVANMNDETRLYLRNGISDLRDQRQERFVATAHSVQNDDADVKASKVLLVLKALVYRDEDIKISLNQPKEFTVAAARPTLSGYSRHGVSMKIANQSPR